MMAFSCPSTKRAGQVCAAPAVALAVVCLMGAPDRTAAAEPWGAIRLPGGVAAACRIAGVGAGPRQKTSFLMDFTRVYFTTAVNRSPPAIERFVKYLNYLLDIEHSLATWPDGLTLTSAADPDRTRQDLFRELLSQLGLRLRIDRGRASVELGRDADDVEHRAWLAAVRVDVAASVDRLNAGERVPVVIPADELPLPVPALWSSVFFKGAAPSVAGLASSPEALFTYLGLMELDRDTLEWVADQPEVFRRILEHRAFAFGAFGRAFRIHDGRVVTPGGASAVPIWEELVGVSVATPAEFLNNLYERNDGRLAYFYATAVEASPARQAWLLGANIVDRKGERDRLRYVEGIRDRFAGSLPTWKIALQPLLRLPVDPALAVTRVDLDPSGAAGPDWWPSLLERVATTDNWPARPKDTLSRLNAQPANANWLLSFLFEQPEEARLRWTWFRFAQRRFPSVDKAAAPDLEVTLRGLKDMPTLVLALDRMGVTDVAIYAEVVRAARRLALAGGEESEPMLRAWQGALATVEQIARHRGIPLPVLTTLLKTLASTIPAKPLAASGLVAGWVIHSLLPAFDAGVDESPDVEAEVLRKLLVADGAARSVFEWEGLSFRVDTTGPVAASAAAMRAVMPGPRLEHLASLDAVAARLAKPFATLDELAGVIRRIDAVAKASPSESLADALNALRKIKAAKDLSKAVRQRPRILTTIDAMTADVMPGFVYALAMSPTDQPARVFAGGPAGHELSSRDGTGRYESFAWRLGHSSVRPNGGTAIRGSLLGLDIARAAEHLSRVAGGPAVLGEPSGAVRDITQSRLADRVVLRATVDWIGAGRDVAAAIAQGRSRAASWRGPAPAMAAIDDALAQAGVGQGQRNRLAWSMARQDWTGVDGLLTVTDLYHLGSPDDLPAGWGQSGRAIDGCWCVLGVGREPIERFRGYSDGHVASAVADLPLRLAEVLAELHLPASLLEPMLPFAIQDALDQAAQYLSDDWEPLTWAGRVTTARVGQYLQALVSWHILAPPDPPAPVELRVR